MHAEVENARKKITAMVQVISAMNSDLGVNSLLFTLSSKANDLVDADKCAVYL